MVQMNVRHLPNVIGYLRYPSVWKKALLYWWSTSKNAIYTKIQSGNSVLIIVVGGKFTNFYQDFFELLTIGSLSFRRFINSIEIFFKIY